MASERYPIVGIDVSKRTLDVCCLIEDEQASPTQTNETENETAERRLQVVNTQSGLRQLSEWLASFGVTRARVCLEATSHYSTAAALYFYEQQWEVYLINPAVSHASLGGTQRRTKTDVADARDLAYFLEGHYRRLHVWKPIEPVYEQLRFYARELALTARQIARAKVAREKLDYITGDAQRVIGKKVESDLAHHLKQRRTLRSSVRKLIRQSTALSERMALLTSAPGIGEATAIEYMAEVPDRTRFRNKGQLAAHAGLTPKLRHSGSHQPASQPLSKIGSQRLRTAFFMASLTASRYNPMLRTVDLRLKARGKTPMQAKIAVARRLLEMLYSMEKHQRQYDPQYQSKKVIPSGS